MSEAVLDTRKVRSWRKYPSYQTIELDWVDRVPDHWIVKRLKWSITACQNGIWGDEPTGNEDDVGCVRVADFDRLRFVLDESVELTKRSVPKDKQVGRLLNRGDLLLEKSGGGDNQPVGALVLFDSDAIAVCSNFVAKVAVADGYCGSYLRYLHACIYANRVNTRSMKQATGIQNLDSGQYFDEKVAFPSLDEQRAIAAFLDRETARIDALVAKKQRLIDLLEEKRLAVISHAVTKGLDTNVTMKDSGLFWFGSVPEHWEMVALKFLVSKPIIDGPHESPERLAEGVPFISAEAVRTGRINFDDKWGFISVEDHARYSKRYKPERNDLLLIKLGATTGVSAIVETDIEFSVWVPLAAIRLKQGVNPHYMSNVLKSKSLRTAYELNWTHGTQQTLGLNTISNLLVPVPPEKEQAAIVSYLESALQRIDLQVAAATKGIHLLQEHRSALISAAVTGQIDVREGGAA